MKTIARSKIQFDVDTQMRDGIDGDTVSDYRDAMKAGAEFPPLVVFFDGTTYWLADGYHRWHAASEAGIESLKCDVKQGSKRDAILFACGANAANGRRRTNADKHRAVMTLLKDSEWSSWSDNVIAEKCGVSHPFVGKLRDQVVTVTTCAAKRRGADGKSYKMPERQRPIAPSIVAPTPPDDDEFFPDDDTDVVDDEPTPEPPKPSNIIGEFRRLFWDSLSVPDRRLIKVFILEEMGGD